MLSIFVVQKLKNISIEFIAFSADLFRLSLATNRFTVPPIPSQVLP
jgi:hypothetical protein